MFRVPPVDRVSARVRGSRPVGPPPPSNLFDVPQPPLADGGGAGTLHHAGGDLLASCPQHSELYAYIIVCTNLARSPACTHGLQYSLRPYGNLGGAAASGRHAPARSMLAQRLKQPTWVNSEVWDISAFWGRRKTTSVAATTHLALVDGCRTPDRLLQVPPRGAGESVWPRRPKRSG